MYSLLFWSKSIFLWFINNSFNLFRLISLLHGNQEGKTFVGEWIQYTRCQSVSVFYFSSFKPNKSLKQIFIEILSTLPGSSNYWSSVGSLFLVVYLNRKNIIFRVKISRYNSLNQEEKPFLNDFVPKYLCKSRQVKF